MQDSWEAGWEEAGEGRGCGLYGFQHQNEKGNLSCHTSLGPAVMPNMKLQCRSRMGMSLFIHISGFCMMKLWRAVGVRVLFTEVLTENSHGRLQPAVDFLVSQKGCEGVFKNYLSQACIFSLSLYHGYVSSLA